MFTEGETGTKNRQVQTWNHSVLLFVFNWASFLGSLLRLPNNFSQIQFLNQEVVKMNLLLAIRDNVGVQQDLKTFLSMTYELQ